MGGKKPGFRSRARSRRSVAEASEARERRKATEAREKWKAGKREPTKERESGVHNKIA